MKAEFFHLSLKSYWKDIYEKSRCSHNDNCLVTGDEFVKLHLQMKDGNKNTHSCGVLLASRDQQSMGTRKSCFKKKLNFMILPKTVEPEPVKNCSNFNCYLKKLQ